MDVEQSMSWFDALYNDGDSFELVAIKDGNARRKTFHWDPGSSVYFDVQDACAAFEAHGFDVYASAMPLNVQEDNVYDRVWVDQDDVDGPWPWGTDADLQWPKPTTLVKTSEDSGGIRWQAIWKLNKKLAETEGRNLMRRLAKRIGADGKVHDPRRILRVPGILNAKRGTPAVYMGGAPDRISPDAFKLPKETAVQQLMEAQVSKPHAILGEWLAGFNEGERNQKAYICARFLRSCDVTHDDALAIIAVGARRCTPPMHEQEVYNAVRSAYHAG